jgi:hypothetical protein
MFCKTTESRETGIPKETPAFTSQGWVGSEASHSDN